MGYGVYQVINNGVDITSIIIILAATFSLILTIYSENIKNDEKNKNKYSTFTDLKDHRLFKQK